MRQQEPAEPARHLAEVAELPQPPPVDPPQEGVQRAVEVAQQHEVRRRQRDVERARDRQRPVSQRPPVILAEDQRQQRHEHGRRDQGRAPGVPPPREHHGRQGRDEDVPHRAERAMPRMPEHRVGLAQRQPEDHGDEDGEDRAAEEGRAQRQRDDDDRANGALAQHRK